MVEQTFVDKRVGYFFGPLRWVMGVGMGLLLGASTAQAQCTITAARGPVGPETTALFESLFAGVNAINSSITTANTAFLTQTSAFIASPPGTQPDQFAGGVWIRGVGGQSTMEAANTGTRVNPTTGNTGAHDCFLSTRSTFAGVQGGIDIGRLDFGNSGWNGHVGVTAGYLSLDNTRSALSVAVDVPFVGLYAALVRGGFFVEAQVRADFFEMRLSDPSIAVRGQTIGATSLGITSSVGYNFNIGSFFVEPSVGVVYAQTDVDTWRMHTILPAARGPTPHTVVTNLDSIETLLGRISARVGTSFVTGQLSLQPFLAASLWHEFAGGSAASITNTNLVTGQTAFIDNSTSRIGTFGQYSIGVAGSIPDSRWLGYARFDYRKGSNIDGWGINGGIRYQFAP
jgi:hypothetical protein